MKKTGIKMLSSLLSLFLFTAQVSAFSIPTAYDITGEEAEQAAAFDEAEIYNAFAEVNDLLVRVQENEDITYAQLEQENSEWVSHLSASSGFSGATYERPPIFSAFMWGCLLNVFGMMIVGLTTGFEGSQMMKSGWGCLINSLLWGFSYWGYFSYSYSWSYF